MCASRLGQAHGADAFTFAASDCTGNIFRSGRPQTISFEIRPVNDAPTTDGTDGATQRPNLDPDPNPNPNPDGTLTPTLPLTQTLTPTLTLTPTRTPTPP